MILGRLMRLVGLILFLTIVVAVHMTSGTAAETTVISTEPNVSGTSVYDDEFSRSTLDSKWHWIREAPSHWNLTASPGYLQITTEAKDIWRDNDSAPLLLQSLQTGAGEDFDVRTRLVMTPTENYHQGGLVIYEDDNHYVRFTYAYINELAFEFVKEINGDFQRIKVEAPPNVNDFHLRIVKVGNNYHAYYSIDGSSWQLIGSHQNVSIAPTEIGLSAFNAEDVTTVEIPANFDYFHLQGIGETCNDLEDRDGDGLPNGWEICGYYHDRLPIGVPDVDLPAMGADPAIPDIFVEIDYMWSYDEEENFVGHSHQPKSAALKRVVDAFAEQGIHLHVDWGPLAELRWGNGLIWGSLSDGEKLRNVSETLRQLTDQN